MSAPVIEYDVVQAAGENDSDSDTATATVAPVASAPSFDTVTVTTAFEICAEPTSMPAVGSGKSRSCSAAPTVRNESLDCAA